MITAGAFTGVGVSGAFKTDRGPEFNIALGTPEAALNATVQLERSFDNGATRAPVTYPDGTVVRWLNGVNTTWSDPELGVWYYLNCTAYTSGTINYRMGQ